MATNDVLDARLRRLGRTLMGGPSVVDGVMAAVVCVEFSPSVRWVRVRRWAARSGMALAACLVLTLGVWNVLLHDGTRAGRTLAAGSGTSGPETSNGAIGTPSSDHSSRTAVAFVIPYEKILLATAKWGYIDTTGRVIVQAQFQEAKGFCAGRAAVKVDDRWGYIDVSGKLVAPAKYESAGAFSNGLAAVKSMGKWGYIDASGREVVNPQFEDADGFREGRAPVKLDGKYGHIDLQGKMVVAPQFTYASPFSEGLAVAKTGEKSGYINPSGKVVIPAQFEVALPFREGLAAVQVPGGKWRFIDKAGKFAFDGEWAYATPFEEGRAMVRPEKNGRYGYIDSQGRLAVPVKYYDASPYSGGLAHVAENNDETGLWGYIDLTGKAMFESTRVFASFHNGLARAQVVDAQWPMGRFGFVDRTGTVAVQDKFEWAEEFSEGLAPFAVGCDHEAVRKAMANIH
jgi:hypothetical protein